LITQAQLSDDIVCGAY